MKWINRLEKILIGYILIESIWKLLGQNPEHGEILFQLIASLLFICTATLIILFVKKKPTYAYFVIAGATFISLGSFGSMISFILINSGYSLQFDPLFFNNIAATLELIIFTSGLAYKSRLAEIEKVNLSYNYTQQLEHNIQLDKELNSIKNKIAEDIHQELGEGISNISVYTGIAEKQARDENSLLRETLFKIRKIALEMHATLQDLSWSLNFQHINEKKLIEKFRQIEREDLLPRNLHLIIHESPEHEDQFLTLDFCRKAIQSLRFAVMACVHRNEGTIILRFNKYDFTIELSDMDLNVEELNETYAAPGIRWNKSTDKPTNEIRLTNFRD
jgi:glucose-6-phosphate-specific signal transduction histidine kinase